MSATPPPRACVCALCAVATVYEYGSGTRGMGVTISTSRVRPSRQSTRDRLCWRFGIVKAVCTKTTCDCDSCTVTGCYTLVEKGLYTQLGKKFAL